MAEFCRECFIRINIPNEKDIQGIVMSDDEDFCEGCEKYGKYVAYILRKTTNK